LVPDKLFGLSGLHTRAAAGSGKSKLKEIAMPLLIIAVLVWIGLHLGVAGTRLRDVVVRLTGEPAFRALFSMLSIISLIFLVRAWNVAPTELIWIAPGWLRWLLVLAMLPAFVLLIASVNGRNPTMIGPPEGAARPAYGIIRVTRHPMLWSFAIWAGVHIAGNGDTAAMVFFGAFLVTALAGMPSIDAKLRSRDPGASQALSATTSIVPFAAIAQGRNQLAPVEIGWLIPTVALLVWIALLLAHPYLFGVAPVAL
jgi:uncharacterized membrane protein